MYNCWSLHRHLPPTPHPPIVVRVVMSDGILYVLQVNVAQDDLNSFLAVAEELKVKGKHL
jgi:hypothetical protein